MHRRGRLSFGTGAAHPPQGEAEFTQNLFLTLRSARQRASRRARPRRCNCDQSAMLAPMGSSPAMTSLFCFGLGYTAGYFIAEQGAAYEHIAGTVRDPQNAPDVARDVSISPFDGTAASPELAPALAATDHLLVSVPPDAGGDPVLRCCGDLLMRASRLQAIVYLSTVGVYGDHGGGWVDEATVPQPIVARRRARLASE